MKHKIRFIRKTDEEPAPATIEVTFESAYLDGLWTLKRAVTSWVRETDEGRASLARRGGVYRGVYTIRDFIRDIQPPYRALEVYNVGKLGWMVVPAADSVADIDENLVLASDATTKEQPPCPAFSESDARTILKMGEVCENAGSGPDTTDLRKRIFDQYPEMKEEFPLSGVQKEAAEVERPLLKLFIGDAHGPPSLEEVNRKLGSLKSRWRVEPSRFDGRRRIMHQQTLDRRFPDSHGYVEIPDVYEDHTDGH